MKNLVNIKKVILMLCSFRVLDYAKRVNFLLYIVISIIKPLFTVGTVVEGEIAMNGKHLGDFMHQESGYMHQDDLFVDNLTVIEHLTIMVRYHFIYCFRSPLLYYKTFFKI